MIWHVYRQMVPRQVKDDYRACFLLVGQIEASEDEAMIEAKLATGMLHPVIAPDGRQDLH